ncbi:MAG: FliI/YscN family ATPase [Myxococcales bacterium]|nr:FliI/YscN family ATPase [Myxococcales bacterium]
MHADRAFFDACRDASRGLPFASAQGRLVALRGTLLAARGLSGRVGDLYEVRGSDQSLHAELVGFDDELRLLAPLGEVEGIAPGARIRRVSDGTARPQPGAALGRVIDALSRPLDGGPPLQLLRRSERTNGDAVSRSDGILRADVLRRGRIDTPFDVGIRSINGFATLGRGMRVGLFAGSGVGKSTLLGQIARAGEADAIVVALIGERGREVREFVEESLGDALSRSVVVVATSDEPAGLRRRAAYLATEIAADLRQQGQHVLLLMDSLTRFCTAQRELGLSAGEPPATRGYPPSVWAELPRLVERAGTSFGRGTVTGIFTVLVEGDDLDEPVADAARAVLDGHVVLSRELAEQGHYPPVDVLASVSRVMDEVISADHAASARGARTLLAALRSARDLISIGAYAAGADPDVDRARLLEGSLRDFLHQGRDERSSIDESFARLAEILAGESR